MIRYSRACGPYQDFLDRGLLLIMKLLNQGFLLVKLKSSLRKIYGRHHDLVDRYGISVTNDHGYVPLVVSTSRFFPHSRFITGFVTRLTRRVPLVEQELINLPEHLSSPPVFSGFLLLDLQLYVYVLQIVVCPFVLFLLAIVLSVLLRYTNSDYRFGIFCPLCCLFSLRYTNSDCPFGIFKLFLS